MPPVVVVPLAVTITGTVRVVFMAAEVTVTIAVFTPVVSADALNPNVKLRGVEAPVILTSGVTVSQLWDEVADT